MGGILGSGGSFSVAQSSGVIAVDEGDDGVEGAGLDERSTALWMLHEELQGRLERFSG
jgi:hypothetical protein